VSRNAKSLGPGSRTANPACLSAACRALAGVAGLVLLLAAAPALVPGTAAALAQSGQAIDSWDELEEGQGEQVPSWSDSLVFFDQPSECPAVPISPFALPPRPERPALGLVFADGRAARWDDLVVVGSELCWPLEECCAALRMTLLWDPGLLRGRLDLDSLAIRFVVGGEVLHAGEQAVQMDSPIAYAHNRLLLPVSGLARMVDAFLRERFSFDVRDMVLRQKRAGPRIGEVHIQPVSGRTYLRWSLPREPRAELSSDGARALLVDLHGLFVDPAAPPAPEPRAGTCLYAILADELGTGFLFHLGGSVSGWKTQWLADRREYQVILTSRAEDLAGRGGYRAWLEPATAIVKPDPRRVVLVLPDERSLDWPSDGERIGEARDFLSALGTQVGERLRAHGFEVDYLTGGSDAGDSSWVPAANRRGAGACLALRPALCADSLARGWRVVTAAAAPLQRPFHPLDRAREQPVRPLQRGSPAAGRSEKRVSLPRWDRLAARHGEASEELAWLLAIHLRAALATGESEAGATVLSGRWPLSALDGLDMPGVVLYVGRLGPGRGFPAVEDWEAIDRVAEALALSLEAYTIRTRGSP